MLLGLCAVVALFVAPAVVAQHLYVVNDLQVGGIRQYTLPVNGGSVPDFTTPSTGAISVDLDYAGDMAIGELGGNISIYLPPLTPSSTVWASFKNGTSVAAYQFAFMSNTDFWVAGLNQVTRFNHPFTNASTPVQTITQPFPLGAYGVAVDAAQNLYIANDVTGSNLVVYAPPYNGAPIVTPVINGENYRKLAVGATQLFVADSGPGAGQIDVYSLPITPASLPAFSITSGVSTPEAVALDSSGNLYVGNLVGATVTVYQPPFSASSTPVQTLPVNGVSIFGIAVDKVPFGVLPAVGSTGGTGGSFFRTGIQLNNPSATPITGRFVFHRAGASAAFSDPTLSYSLNPGETQSIADLLPAMGQSGIGSADLVTSSGPFPTVVTRVFNDGGSKGTSGFSEDLLNPGNALGAGDQVTLIVPADLSRFRYNVGVRSMTAGATISVSQRNAAGNPVRTIAKTYAGNYFEQVDVGSFLGAAPAANDSLTITVTSGSLFVYGATTDNTTQDPSVQIGRK